jgi:hypothetical protein
MNACVLSQKRGRGLEVPSLQDQLPQPGVVTTREGGIGRAKREAVILRCPACEINCPDLGLLQRAKEGLETNRLRAAH